MSGNIYQLNAEIEEQEFVKKAANSAKRYVNRGRLAIKMNQNWEEVLVIGMGEEIFEPPAFKNLSLYMEPREAARAILGHVRMSVDISLAH